MIELSGLASWGLLLGLTVGPSLLALLLWSPLLLTVRFRALFRALPPTRSLLPSYALTGFLLWLPFLVGLLWVLSGTAESSGGVTATGLFDVVIPTGFAYVVGLPTGAVLGLPSVGLDWDPSGYGAGTWVLLLAGAAWWAVLLGGPVILLALVMALPT